MAIKSEKQTSISIPTVKEMLEAGVHFGHETKRWNPSFREYIFDKRGKFHVIDLEKTVENLKKALKYLVDISSKKEILFVGTKRQARDIMKEEATRCGAHFITNRWVGGLLTNFEIIHKGIRKLRKVEEKLSGNLKEYTPQELSVQRREWGRLDRLFGGVKFLDELPGVIVLIDPRFEWITVKEARVAKIPVVAVVDSNSNPNLVDYPVPGNDDAIKSIQLFSKVLADAVLVGNKGKGVQHVLADFSKVGVDKEGKKEEEKRLKDTKKNKSKTMRVRKTTRKRKSTKTKKSKVSEKKKSTNTKKVSIKKRAAKKKE